MGYFVSILRERIANFEAPPAAADETAGKNPGGVMAAQGVSINDLRKNLRDLNDCMDQECRVSAAWYGVMLEASLITGIDPPLAAALFEILEMQRLIDGGVAIDLIPPGSDLLAQILAARGTSAQGKKPHVESPAETRVNQTARGEQA